MYDVETAHKHTFKNRDEITKSAVIRCMSCATFLSDTNIEWADKGQTACCKLCMIDAVLGDASGFPIGDNKFVDEFYKKWFT